jgi:hypothetical protein
LTSNEGKKLDDSKTSKDKEWNGDELTSIPANRSLCKLQVTPAHHGHDVWPVGSFINVFWLWNRGFEVNVDLWVDLAAERNTKSETIETSERQF